MEYEVTTCNDNEALVDKINEDCFFGNYGLCAAMSVILEIRRLRQLHQNVNFKWIKGHQDPKKHDENPAIYLNNKCDEIANEEREKRRFRLDFLELNLNTTMIRNNKIMLGNVKKELDAQSQDAILNEHWIKRKSDCVNECRLDVRRTVIRKKFALRVKIVNGIIPTYKKMNMCDSTHTSLCPRCGLQEETWQHVLKCKCNTKNKEFLTNLKAKLAAMSDHQLPSFKIMRSLEKFMQSDCKDNNKDDEIAGIDKIFLGWISKSWIESNEKSAIKWYNCVVTHCMQHMVESWDERNLQVHSEEGCKANLKQRVLEHFHNREKHDSETNEFVEETMEKMDEMTKDQLCVKIEILRRKVRKAKKSKKERKKTSLNQMTSYF